jgi:hypothetical protein
LGFSKDSLRRTRSWSQLPARRCRHRLAFGSPLPGVDLVPSSWFLTTPTACSSATVQVCCALLPTMGFTAFQPAANRCSRDAVPPSRALLLDRSDDVKVVSHLPIVGSVTARPRVTTPPPVHRFPCPLAVIRAHRRESSPIPATSHQSDLKALLHVRSRVPPSRCRAAETHALLGLFLLRRAPPGVATARPTGKPARAS